MKEDGIELRVDNSAYYFKLDDLLRERNISKSQLCRDTNTDYKVISRLMDGNLVRIDIYVLARVCEYLDCDICDIIKFKRNLYKKV